jgi:hypothetical protein
MTMRTLWWIVICAVAVSAGAIPAHPGQAGGAAAPVSTVFTDRVRAYVALQKGLEDSGAQRPTTEAEQIADRQDALAGRIAAARRDFRQGDIFTPDVAGQYRTIIREAFQGPDGKNMRRTILEGDPERATVLRVNVAYPEEIPLGTMPPTLLRRLPALPAELAYRVVGRALVLKDVKTNLIVDFIPDALPQLR